MTETIEARASKDHKLVKFRFQSSLMAIQYLFTQGKYEELRTGREKVKALVKEYITTPGHDEIPVIIIERIYKRVTENPNFSFT